MMSLSTGEAPPLCLSARWRLMHTLRIDSRELTRAAAHSHVILPKHIAKNAPKGRLLTETEWRGVGVQQSRGGVHYAIHRCQPPARPAIHRSLVACATWSHALSLPPHLPPGLSRTSCSSADRTAPIRRRAWWPASALIPTPAR